MLSIRNKNKYFVAMVAAVGFILAPTVRAENVEISLDRVFVPESGYGSNNIVQLTLDGRLPNSCYQLGKSTVETKDGGHSFIVHQFAERQIEGVCANGAALPSHLADSVPFTYDVNIGRLSAGKYQVNYDSTSHEPRSRRFNVYASKHITADDFPYAAVSTVMMWDIVNGTQPVSVQLGGTFTSTCSYLADVKVTEEDDVIVLQPILGQRKDRACEPKSTPFTQKVDLGLLNEGRFLLHVRAMSGNAINHAFSVIRPD